MIKLPRITINRTQNTNKTPIMNDYFFNEPTHFMNAMDFSAIKIDKICRCWNSYSNKFVCTFKFLFKLNGYLGWLSVCLRLYSTWEHDQLLDNNHLRATEWISFKMQLRWIVNFVCMHLCTLYIVYVLVHDLGILI